MQQTRRLFKKGAMVALLALGESIIGLGGCGGAEKQSHDAPNCRQAWDNMLVVIQKDPDMARQYNAVPVPERERGSRAVVEECERDKWPEEVRACYGQAASTARLHDCEEMLRKLPHEQK